MRWLLVLGLVASCVSEGPRRPLVVDNVPYGADRAAIRRWHLAHGWCPGRVWATTDEFVRCDPRPQAKPTDPPIFTLIRYDDSGWSISYAVFAPVPLAWVLRWNEAPFNPDHELLDPDGEGMYVDLADRLRAIDRRSHPRPYADLLFDALAPELDKRCGNRTWEDDHGFGATWQTKRTEIGLFVSSNGHWIIETHEIRPEQLWNVHLHGAFARTDGPR
jgi:hypothetical protein